LLARKSKKLAAVRLANKMARIIRAMMVSGLGVGNSNLRPSPAGEYCG
jgi:hypothetical protein